MRMVVLTTPRRPAVVPASSLLPASQATDFNSSTPWPRCEPTARICGCGWATRQTSTRPLSGGSAHSDAAAGLAQKFLRPEIVDQKPTVGRAQRLGIGRLRPRPDKPESSHRRSRLSRTFLPDFAPVEQPDDLPLLAGGLRAFARSRRGLPLPDVARPAGRGQAAAGAVGSFASRCGVNLRKSAPMVIGEPVSASQLPQSRSNSSA